MRKRLLEGLRPYLSLLLTAVLVIGLLPLSALADNQRPEVPSLSWEEREDVAGKIFKEKSSAKTTYTAYEVAGDGSVTTEEVPIVTTEELGTAANPIAITNEADLILFGQQTGGGTKGKYYILEQKTYNMQGDARTMIPLFPATWSNSGMPDNAFQGTLIGNGAVIENVCIVGWGDSGQSYYPGLFSGVSEGSLWGLTLKNAKIYADTGENVPNVMGGLVGSYGEVVDNMVQLAGCTVYASFVGTAQQVGGLIGTVENWYDKIFRAADCQVSITGNLQASNVLGGLIGSVASPFAATSCTVNVSGKLAAVSGSSMVTVGGLVGSLDPRESTVILSKNKVTVEAISATATATAEIDAVAGGLIGTLPVIYMPSGSEIPITENQVSVTGNITADSSNGSAIAGGLIGRNWFTSSDNVTMILGGNRVTVEGSISIPAGGSTRTGSLIGHLEMSTGFISVSDSVAVVTWPLTEERQYARGSFGGYPNGKYEFKNGSETVLRIRDDMNQIVAGIHRPFGCYITKNEGYLEIQGGNGVERNGLWVTPSPKETTVTHLYLDDGRLTYPGGGSLTLRPSEPAQPGGQDTVLALPQAQDRVGVTIDSEGRLHFPAGSVLNPGTAQVETLAHAGAIDGAGALYFELTLAEVGTGATESGLRKAGDTVTLNPGTKEGFTFQSWTAQPQVEFSDAAQPNAAFTMPKSPVTVTANWRSNTPTVTGVTVAPASPTVQKGTIQAFTATVAGENNPGQEVTWAVTGKEKEGTTISATGLLTVAADETATTLTVTATSNVDNTKSGSATVTVTDDTPAPVYAISATPAVLDFGTLREGYAQPEAKTVIVTNIGNQQVTLIAPSCPGADYELGALTNTLAFGATATFTVQPKAELAAGTHSDTIIIGADQGQGAEVTVSFTVESNTPAVTYTLTFDSQGGSKVGPLTGVAAGATVTLPTPARGNYRFDGWFTAATGGTQFTSATPVTGNLALYARWTYLGGSGGGSSSNTTTKTEKHEDGSTTKTVTDKKTGTVTETTKYPDGSQTVVETRKDGTVTTTTQDEAGNQTETMKQPDGIVTTTETRTDGTKVATKTDKDGATSATITVPEDLEAVTVTIPTQNKPGAGTVAILVREDGSREVVKTSLPGENGVTITLTQGASVEIVDNAKHFDDLPDTHWAAEAVAFVTARELFAGIGEGKFATEQPMSRAMLFTVLARLDGADLTGGETWYEKAAVWAKENGVSDGQDPDGQITREQLVTMLWRYAGSPVSSRALDGFNDAGQAGDFALDALSWAVEQGVLAGKDGGVLDPKGDATRAEVAAMLQRFLVREL